MQCYSVDTRVMFKTNYQRVKNYDYELQGENSLQRSQNEWPIRSHQKDINMNSVSYPYFLLCGFP